MSRHRQAIEDKKIDFTRFWSRRKEAKIHTSLDTKPTLGIDCANRVHRASLFRIPPLEVLLGEGYGTAVSDNLGARSLANNERMLKFAQAGIIYIHTSRHTTVQRDLFCDIVESFPLN